MPESAPATTPLSIDRVERARGKGDQARLRLTGRWWTTAVAGPDALLVVQMHGRRHRFATVRDPDDAVGGAAALGDVGASGDVEGGIWTASFEVPDWAVPEQPGQAALWIGSTVVPVPPPGSAPLSEPVALRHSPPPPAPPPAEPLEPDALTDEPGRAGPLADLLFKETVSALHAELEQRSAEAARLRGALAQARSDLEARSGGQADLETAHAELRHELARLMAAVTEQRREFDGQLATLRTQRDRAREEITAAREESEARLGRARSELDDRLATARSEFDQQLAAVRARAEADVAGAREEADARLTAARRQAESEADAARAESETMIAAVRAESETRASDAETRARAAEARAAALNERVASLMAAERRRGEEAAALREQLAGAHISRDAALSEAGGLRAELERIGSELAVARERAGASGEELSEAQQLLADARALTEQLRNEAAG